MKKVFLYIAILVSATGAFAQQTPMYSMYMFNEFAYNPSIAGLKGYYEAQVNNRYQFVGIENAPVTATITLNGRLKSLPMGWGGMIFNDSQGAFSKLGVYGAYAYHIKTGRYSKLSLGLNIGAIRYAVDMTKIQFLEDELNLNESMYKSIRPDATFGVHYETYHYFAGISVDQLFNNQIDITADTIATDNALNRFKSHVNMMFGCKFNLATNLKLESAVVARKVYASPWQFEITERVTYHNTIWAGASYRYQDAVVLFVGYTFRDLISFGYAYDITYSKMRYGSRGAHEVFLSIAFDKRK